MSMRKVMPSLEDIERLVSFLPRLPAAGFIFIENNKSPDGSGRHPGLLRYPDYAPIVQELYDAASAECWHDYEYDPGEVGSWLTESGFIEAADLSEIRTLLTYCVRGERFCDGFWGGTIEDGHIRRILERLVELRASME